MAQAITIKRGVLYCVAEGTAGDYEAPTQSGTPDIPIRGVTNITVTREGGIEVQDGDYSPYPGHARPLRGDGRWTVQFDLKVPTIPDATDETSLDIHDLLDSCPLSFDSNTGSGPVVISPAAGTVVGTHINPCSMTLFDEGGNVYTGQGGVSRIVSVSGGPVFHTLRIESHFLFRDTLGDTVAALSAGSLTIAAAFDDYLDGAFASTKAGTLAVTGLAGTAPLEVYDYSVDYGMVLADTPARTGTHGFGMSTAMCKNAPRATLTIPEYEEVATAAGRQVWGEYFAAAELDDVSLTFGSSGTTFIPFRFGKARVTAVNPAEFNERKALEVEITGLTESGNDAWEMQFGA